MLFDKFATRLDQVELLLYFQFYLSHGIIGPTKTNSSHHSHNDIPH